MLALSTALVLTFNGVLRAYDDWMVETITGPASWPSASLRSCGYGALKSRSEPAKHEPDV